jgi:hypothetical protein
MWAGTNPEKETKKMAHKCGSGTEVSSPVQNLSPLVPGGTRFSSVTEQPLKTSTFLNELLLIVTLCNHIGNMDAVKMKKIVGILRIIYPIWKFESHLIKLSMPQQTCQLSQSKI